MSVDPLRAAAEAISDASPNIKRFARSAADRIIALEHPAPVPTQPTYALTLAPNWNNAADSNDVLNNYNAVWQWSNNEKGYAPPNGKDVYRVVLLDPRLKDKSGRPGVDEWYVAFRRGWPSDFDPTRHGSYGREGNCHNVATNDSGPNGGVGWGFGSGTSAFALDWLPGSDAPSVQLEWVQSGGLTVKLPVPARDVIHEYVLHFVAGRTDGSTARAGAFEVLADGKSVASGANVNTVQRAKAADGVAYTQKWVALAWDGDYTKDLQVRTPTLFQLTGIGQSLAEARADVPHVTGGTFASQGWNGKTPNLGAPALVTI